MKTILLGYLHRLGQREREVFRGLLQHIRQSISSSADPTSSNPLLEFCLDGGLADKKPPPAAPLHARALSNPCFSSSTESFGESSPKPKGDAALQIALLLNPLLRICSRTPFGQNESEELRALLQGGGGSGANKIIGCDNKQIHATGPEGQTAMHFLISGELPNK